MRHSKNQFYTNGLLLRFFLVLVVTLLTGTYFSQTKKLRVSVNINLKVETEKVRIYKNDADKNENIKTVVLKMNYGESEIINPEDAKVLKEGGCNIMSVDLVYTDYQNKDVQDLLNTKRITELYFLLPDIFKQKMACWKYIEQLGYSTEEDAKKLFHGIVIKYIKVPFYKPRSIETMTKDLNNKSLADSSLFKVFEKYINYENELVCVDLTGSMSPYYFQVFLWLNLKKAKNH